MLVYLYYCLLKQPRPLLQLQPLQLLVVVDDVRDFDKSFAVDTSLGTRFERIGCIVVGVRKENLHRILHVLFYGPLLRNYIKID